MKRKNFPLRKLTRQARAQGFFLTDEQINHARSIRSKKSRAGTTRMAAIKS